MESAKPFRRRTADLSFSAAQFHLAAAIRIPGEDRRIADLPPSTAWSRWCSRIPALLARLELLPAEKMLAAIDPGYQALGSGRAAGFAPLQRHLHFVQYNADSPTGAGYADALADLFYDSPPVKEFRKKYTSDASRQPQASAAGAAESPTSSSAARKKPNIAIVEFRPAYPFRPERIRAVPRLLPRGRLRGRDRFAGAAGISQRRAAQGQLRNQPGLPPPGRAGIPDPLRSDASAGAGVSRPRGLRGEQLPRRNWRTRRRCSAC